MLMANQIAKRHSQSAAQSDQQKQQGQPGSDAACSRQCRPAAPLGVTRNGSPNGLISVDKMVGASRTASSI